MFYAIEHRYGANVADERGYHIGTTHAFATRRERDQWVSDGPDLSSGPYARTIASRRWRLDRQLIERQIKTERVICHAN